MRLLWSSRHLLLCFIGLVAIITLSHAARSYTSPEEWAKKGDEALALGEYEKAIKHYSEAINGDSSSFSFFWKRSIPYLQAQKYREALSDLNRALSLDGKHVGALLRRSRLLHSIGKFDDAIIDLEKVLKQNPEHKEALEQMPIIKAARTLFEEATSTIKSADSLEGTQKESTLMRGLNTLSTVLEKAPTFEKGLLLRARVSFKLQRWESVLEDMTHLLRSSPTNTAALYLRGKALLYAGEQDTALTHFIQCLNYDSFDDDCKKAKEGLATFQSNLEKANKALELTKYREAAALYKLCMEWDPNWRHVMPSLWEKLAKCYLGMNDGEKALEASDKMIGYDDKVQAGFLLKGEAFLLLERWDDAIREMHNALNLGQTMEARQGVQKAEKAKKMAQRKDYYKILGIAKDASKRDISKSYRKLSMKYHPDKNTEADSEQMYRDVTEAYDVLSNDDKRRKYDLGEDLDQPQQQGHPGNPFSFFYGFH